MNRGNYLQLAYTAVHSIHLMDPCVIDISNQHPVSFIGSGGNSMMSSMSGQRITRQMIPTPGFNSNNNLSYMNSESSYNGDGFSSVDSTMMALPEFSALELPTRSWRRSDSWPCPFDPI